MLKREDVEDIDGFEDYEGVDTISDFERVIDGEIEKKIEDLRTECKERNLTLLCAVQGDDEQASVAFGDAEEIAYTMAHLVFKLSGARYKEFLKAVRKMVENIDAEKNNQ